MRVTRTATVTATSGVPAPPWILEYWWLLAGAGILGLIVVGGTVAYQESERQKLLALALGRL